METFKICSLIHILCLPKTIIKKKDKKITQTSIIRRLQKRNVQIVSPFGSIQDISHNCLRYHPGNSVFCNAKSPQTFYIRQLLLERQRGPFKTNKPDLLHSCELMQCNDENRCINQKVVEAETLNKIWWLYTNLNITTVQSI